MNNVQSKAFSGDGVVSPVTVNADSNFIAGNAVAFWFSYWPNALPFTVKIAGLAATKAVGISCSGGDTFEIWYLLDVPAGHTDIELTSGGVTFYYIGALLEMNSGYVVGTIAKDQTGTNNANSAAPTVSTAGTTVVPSETVVAGWSNGTDASGEAAPPTGYTNRYNSVGVEGGAGDSKITTTVGTQTPIWAVAGGGVIEYASGIATFKATNLSNSQFFGMSAF